MQQPIARWGLDRPGEINNDKFYSPALLPGPLEGYSNLLRSVTPISEAQMQTSADCPGTHLCLLKVPSMSCPSTTPKCLLPPPNLPHGPTFPALAKINQHNLLNHETCGSMGRPTQLPDLPYNPE